MKQLGFILDDFSHSQLSHEVFGFVAESLKHSLIDDAVLFYKDNSRPCRPAPCAVMQAYEAFGFRGSLIATSVDTARIALQCPSARRYFYCHDLEWCRKPGDFRTWHAVYSSNKLELLAREGHFDVIESCWGRRPLPLTLESLHG